MSGNPCLRNLPEFLRTVRKASGRKCDKYVCDCRKNEPGIPDHQAMIRERKPCVVLTFSTTTAAMSMEKRCGEHKIPGRLIPVPREITAGCGLAWKMPEEDYEKYKDEVESLNITVEQKVWLKL